MLTPGWPEVGKHRRPGAAAAMGSCRRPRCTVIFSALYSFLIFDSCFLFFVFDCGLFRGESGHSDCGSKIAFCGASLTCTEVRKKFRVVARQDLRRRNGDIEKLPRQGRRDPRKRLSSALRGARWAALDLSPLYLLIGISSLVNSLSRRLVQKSPVRLCGGPTGDVVSSPPSYESLKKLDSSNRPKS